MSNAHMKLHSTDITRDFFLPAVSAHTEVGNSNNQIANVDIFVMIIIWASDSPTYL